MNYYIAIPTYNGGSVWKEVVDAIKKNISSDVFIHVIDSSSKDETVSIAIEAGFNIVTIGGHQFNHGGTRNLAVSNFAKKYDVVIFLTQDAIPEAGFIENIISVFDNPGVACAYGRQLPHNNANPLAKHARYYNYPAESYIASRETVKEMGLKAVFMSNSFSAYRLSVFEEIGGFPSNTILCEDMFFAGKALLRGHKIAYVADAKVRHSHNYSAIEEFKRYFDIGVFHECEPWIRHNFGGAGGEGKKFILSELKFLAKHYPHWIPVAFINNFMKILGYKLGQRYKHIPYSVIQRFSMHKKFWIK
ncbi:glycosyltransferase family 2 protein [Escherichia coli]|uniref:glycosyltransferase family 2 protein n=1 Tax=Escherichia coli TaxID=562 RepID=UPI0021C24CA6|nr:glycosyltransferase family 2 protein [Escherichia coli]